MVVYPSEARVDSEAKLDSLAKLDSPSDRRSRKGKLSQGKISRSEWMVSFPGTHHVYLGDVFFSLFGGCSTINLLT